MSVQTLKLGGRDYVIVPKKDFQDLKERAKAKPPTVRKPRRLTAQDRGDIAEAIRRLNDPNDKPVSYEVARKRLGLA